LEKEPWRCPECGHDIFLDVKGGYIDHIREPGISRLRWREYEQMAICAKCHTRTGVVEQA
jgi:hypothetical protein